MEFNVVNQKLMVNGEVVGYNVDITAELFKFLIRLSQSDWAVTELYTTDDDINFAKVVELSDGTIRTEADNIVQNNLTNMPTVDVSAERWPQTIENDYPLVAF